MRFAIVENSTVTNVAEAPSPLGANWTATSTAGIGWTYSGGVFTPPPAPAPLPVPADPCAWLIDIGPFYDRFGAAKMPVLTSADATVKAILSDVSIRKWIDLKRTDVASSLAYIGSVVPSLTSNLQTAILTTPVAAEENRALRKSYY